MLKQAQDAMQKAQELEGELANERIAIDKGPVKAIFDGTGVLVSIKIDKDILDPEDVEALEDLIVSTMRDGSERATTMRNERVQSIMPNIPGL